MKMRASLFVLAMLAASSAAAQTWTGAGPDGNWSTGANWSGGVPPASSATTQLTFPVGPIPNRSPVVDAPWTVNQLIFQTGNYTVSGQAITFAGANAGIVSSGGATNTLSNPIVLSVPTSIGGSANFVTLTGTISGPGSLLVGGNGGTLLTGNNTFTGGVTVVGGGVLRITGSMPGPVSVTSAGIFGGAGTIAGSVTLSGANATLNLLSGTLATGNLALGAGTGANYTINGNTTAQYGNLVVTGSVNITGAALGLSGTYVPVAGDVFTIIANDGADPVVGIFAGLPEGTPIVFNGVPLRISYVGGTGNDVTLTAVGPAGAQQIPTLSEWGLIAIASVLLLTGMRRMRH